MRAPVIIQTSVTPSGFLRPRVLASAFHAMFSEMDIPACMHLDHCDDSDWCMRCSDAVYTNIMIDGSRLDFEKNIRVTREIVSYCHSAGQSVEGELGTVRGVEEEIKIEEGTDELCNPDKAVEFVNRTEIDLFAPAIGTAHGVYKTANPVVDFDRLAEIKNRLGTEDRNIPLVIHGGTGLPDNYINRLISAGGSKYNVSTALKHVLIDSSYEYLKTARNEYNPGKYDIHVREETKKEIKKWIRILGTEDKA